MRTEAIEFGSVGAMQKAVAEFARIRKSPNFCKFSYGRARVDMASSATVLDEAFAGFSGDAPDRASASNWRSATRELVADIAAQLELLDRQRRELTRLLESVPAHSATE